ncbi:MAG: 3-oxoacyl-ACP reductase FabG [Clostridia bacterium]
MNKTVVITGAAKGIGRAIALEFKKQGYNVCITYNKSKIEAEKLKNEGIDIYHLDMNVTEKIDIVIDQIVSKYGKIDCLVNNAGICQTKLFTDLTNEDITEMLNVNLISMMNITKSVLNKTMLKHKNASVINISSIWGITGGSCEVAYSTSKAGVIGFTKSLAHELGLSNITVNSIAPGAIKTDMLNSLNQDELESFKQEIPLNRIGEPEDIAKVATFLASDGARYITGQVLAVDGGYTI